MRRISVNSSDWRMMHDLFRDKAIILIRSHIFICFVLRVNDINMGVTSRGLNGFATRLTVDAYSLAAKAATYAALSAESDLVTAIFNKSAYSMSSQPRCNKLVHSLKLTGSV